MPNISVSAKNAALAAIVPVSASLHTAYSSTGANEVTGGSYARVAVAFTGPAAGRINMVGSATFAIPTTGTAAFVGLWDVSNVFLGMIPLGAGLLQPFSMTDLVSNALSSAAHGLASGDALAIWAGDGGALPPPLADGNIYYVVAGGTADELQLSSTAGGTALTYSTTGKGFLQKAIPIDFSTLSGTFQIVSLAIDAMVA